MDILDLLQAKATGNANSAAIKKELGAQLSFHSGTNDRGLFHPDRSAPRINTLKPLAAFAQGGGHLLHNIPADMPAANGPAFSAVGREFGSNSSEEQIEETFEREQYANPL